MSGIFNMVKKKYAGARGRSQAITRFSNADAMWILRLYVAGHDSRSRGAFTHLKKICDMHMKGPYRIVVVDLLKHPQFGCEDQILSLPALVRKLPRAVKNIIGYLSDTERVLIGLNRLPAPTS
jgi:circadian clock protein KaiB